MSATITTVNVALKVHFPLPGFDKYFCNVPPDYRLLISLLQTLRRPCVFKFRQNNIL